jgi:putative redox protein
MSDPKAVSDPKPPMTVALSWSGDLRFDATSSGQTVVIDGDTKAGISPTQALAIGLLGCMSADVVDIVRKGRHPLTAFDATLKGERATAPPRRFLAFALHFTAHGAVPAAAVERAIALSHEKYCSVWHSLRQDISLTTTFDVVP